MQDTLRNYPNLTIKAGSVADLILGPLDGTQTNPTHGTKVYGQVKGLRTGESQRNPTGQRCKLRYLVWFCRSRRDATLRQSHHLYWDVSWRRDTCWHEDDSFWPRRVRLATLREVFVFDFG